MKKIATLGAFLLLLVPLACSSTGGIDRLPSSSPNPEVLSLLFTSSRQLELEPCGCSSGPRGGLAREWNLVSKWRGYAAGSQMILSGGRTFVPDFAHFNEKLLDQYRNKARTLVSALNQLKIQALSPTAYDASLGVETLKQLRSQAKFPLISANLSLQNGKPLFDTHAEFSHPKLPILVTGVARSISTKEQVALGIKVEPAAESLRKTLDRLEKKPRFVILVTDLPTEEVTALLETVPEINVVLGSNSLEALPEIEQLSARTILINPDDRARSVAQARFQLTATPEKMFNFNLAPKVAKSGESFKRELKAVEKELKKKKLSASLREELLRKKAAIVGKTERTNGIPREFADGYIVYEGKTEALDDRFEEPKNPMNELVSAYNEQNRQREIKADEKSIQ